ncbi:MAG: T9SS C-terminal target domain-containing protein [Bacteroidetes bacterium]|nr:MAG: T9SS C-terminal target domain-containing protein [Bacteroidota bacterium]REK33332.1 MAG: T9SS C-terminal target domain-containing protein [Bacteroidota bacterium]
MKLKSISLVYLLLISLLTVQNCFASGTSCPNSHAVSIDTNAVYNSLNLQDSVFWFSFNGNRDSCRFSIRENINNINALAIYKIELFKGNCTNLISMDSILFNGNDSLNEYYFNFRNIQQGQNYYLILHRLSNSNSIADFEISDISIPCNSSCVANCNLIANGDFSFYTTGSITSPFNPINGQVCCWTAAWGTPQIQEISGNKYARLWTQSIQPIFPGPILQYGEGVITNTPISISTNHIYLLNYSIKVESASPGNINGPPLDLFFIGLLDNATSGLPTPTYSTGEIIPTFNGENIDVQTNLNNVNWESKSVCFSPLQNSDRLYFYPRHNTFYSLSSFPNYVNVDNIMLYQLDYNAQINTACGNSTTIGPCDINANSGLNLVSYLWSPGGATTAQITVSPTSTTTYTLTTHVNSPPATASCDVISTYIVNVSGGISVNITPSNPVLTCSNSSITLNAGSGFTSYQWSGPISGSSQTLNVNLPGVYTVIVTSPTCTSSASVTVLQNNSSPSISISSSSNDICSGQNTGVILTADCPDCNSFIWNLSGIQNQQITVYPTTSTTYTVTGIAANGCTSSASTTISVFPSGLTTPQIVGSTSNCASAPNATFQYINANWLSQYDGYYNWTLFNSSGGDISSALGYPTSTNEIVEIHWPNPNQSGILVLNFGLPGCQKSDTIYIQECCEEGITQVFYDGNTVDDMTSGNSITANDIVINGTFIINRDFAFINCRDISFAPGARLLVKSGIVLTIENSVLRPFVECCKMWKGIYVETNGKILFTGNEIHQAEHAIHVVDKCSFLIRDSEFKNNYVGMYAGDIGTTSVTGLIENTRFTSMPYNCEPGLGQYYYNFVDRYLGQKTATGNRPFAGIELKNVSYIRIGNSLNTPTGNINFDNLSNGILSDNSNVYIDNCTFDKILPVWNYSNSLLNVNGCAVRSNRSTINFTGLGGLSTSPHTIKECQYGVALLSLSTGLVRQVHTNPLTRYGIYVRFSRDVQILNNCINAMFKGIYTYNNPNIKLNIEENKISLNPFISGGSCIEFSERATPASRVVYKNQLFANKGNYGIYSNGTRASLIQENYIQTTNARINSGIHAVGSPFNVYKCNILESINTGNRNGNYGINISLSTGSEVSCNSTDENGYGIRFNGPCANTRLQGNEIYNHNTGLYLAYDANIGQQYNKGNRWLGTYTNYGAFLSNIDNFRAFLNRFSINPVCSGCITSNNGVPFGWFLSNSNDYFTCIDSSTCQLNSEFLSTITNEDILVASDSSFGQQFEQTTNYYMKRYLYDKIRENPEFMANVPILQSFYNQNILNSVGLYSQLEIEITDALKWESTYLNVYNTNVFNISSFTLRIHELDSLIEHDSSLKPERDSLISLVEQLMVSNENLLQDILLIQEYKLNNVEIENETIPVSELYESNEQIVNEIYLNTLAKDEYYLNSDQKQQLESIIVQCPFAGGPAVYTALMLYQMINDSIIMDEDLTCPTFGIAPRHGRKISNEVVVYPNPTNSSIFIKNLSNLENASKLLIFDTYGKLLGDIELPLDVDVYEIHLNDLSPSIYYYRIMNDNSILKSDKIVLIR